MRLYLEGLATGDFEPVFRELVGETTALSASTVVRLKEQWAEEYDAWRRRPLGGHRYAYIWADGVYLGVGTEAEKTTLLCILGVREDGEKELLALVEGYRESTESWAGVLRDLRTTNPLESIFAGVRLRTAATKRLRKRDTTLYLVFKLIERLSRNWRALNGGATLMQLVLAGCTFKDGVLQRTLVGVAKAA